MIERKYRRSDLRRLVGLQPLPPQGELPRFSNGTRRAWYILTSPVARFSSALIGASLLTESRSMHLPDITIGNGSFEIEPESINFRTSPRAVEGDTEKTDNIVEKKDISLQGLTLDKIKQFTLTNPEAVQGPDSDKVIINGNVQTVSPYWLKIPNMLVLDPQTRKQNKQDLFVSLSIATVDAIRGSAQIQVVQQENAGYFVGKTKVVQRNGLGKVSNIIQNLPTP